MRNTIFCTKKEGVTQSLHFYIFQNTISKKSILNKNIYILLERKKNNSFLHFFWAKQSKKSMRLTVSSREPPRNKKNVYGTPASTSMWS